MNSPRISVICIFYNAERFFAEAIDSVLAQDCDDFELLLADDGATDASTAMARDYVAWHPDRVRYLEHEGHANRGMSATRNLGLAHARGEYVAFIDADDRWRPDKLRAQAAILDAHPDVGIVCGTVNYWSSWEGGKDRVVPTGWTLDGISRPPQTSLKLYPLGTAGAPCPSDAMMRKSVIDAVEGFEAHFTGMYEDQAFFSKVWLATSAYFSRQVWLDYRRHPDSCMETAIREGRYPEIREYFLDWFASYLDQRQFAGKEDVSAALARAKWRIAHPFIARVERRGRSLARRLLATVPVRQPRSGRSV
jgi:glycosyltransferase involved in cell wall biosynthesis